MRKKLLSILIIIIVLNFVGCMNQIHKKDIPTINGANKTEETVESNPSPTETGFKDGSVSSNQAIQKKDIFESFALPKSKILAKYGEKYEIIQTGAEGAFEGYRYNELGITFVFDEDGKVSFVNCDDQFEIDGVKAGMNFEQIQEKMGKGEIEETWFETPDNKAYKLEYNIDDMIIRFLSFEKDGSESSLTILMKQDRN